MTEYVVGSNCHIDDGVQLGHSYDRFGEPTVIGDRATIRSGTIIYASATVGEKLVTGHGVLIRERTSIGDDVLVGTSTTIDGYTTIGSHVSLQTGVYIPAETEIGNRVFLGPHAVLTNDPYPVRNGDDRELNGPTIENGVTVGANATILPEVTIGEDAFVAAGSVVTDHVPPRTLAIGTPAKHLALPPELQGGNLIA